MVSKRHLRGHARDAIEYEDDKAAQVFMEELEQLNCEIEQMKL